MPNSNTRKKNDESQARSEQRPAGPWTIESPTDGDWIPSRPGAGHGIEQRAFSLGARCMPSGNNSRHG